MCVVHTDGKLYHVNESVCNLIELFPMIRKEKMSVFVSWRELRKEIIEKQRNHYTLNPDSFLGCTLLLCPFEGSFPAVVAVVVHVFSVQTKQLPLQQFMIVS